MSAAPTVNCLCSGARSGRLFGLSARVVIITMVASQKTLTRPKQATIFVVELACLNSATQNTGSGSQHRRG
eukprot:11903091-Alexandrium_andersonii.AAC.1